MGVFTMRCGGRDSPVALPLVFLHLFLIACTVPTDAACPADHYQNQCCERFFFDDCSADILNDCCALKNMGNCKPGYAMSIDYDSPTCNGFFEAVCCTPSVTNTGQFPGCTLLKQSDILHAPRTQRGQSSLLLWVALFSSD